MSRCSEMSRRGGSRGAAKVLATAESYFSINSARTIRKMREGSAICRCPPGMQFADEKLSHVTGTHGARFGHETVKVALQL